MSKRKRQLKLQRRVLGHKRKRLIALATVSLIVTLGLGAVFGPWKISRARAGLQALFSSPVPTPPVPPPTSPSKEYIYVGGRLIATEEGGCLSGYTGTPYLGTSWSIPGTVQAENFDQGGEGVAYHDVDPGSANGTYRSGGVYIENCGNPNGGCNIGSTWPGEWLRYSINVTADGTYSIETQVASGNGGGGAFHIEVDCIDITGPLTVPNTGGWQNYQTVVKSGLVLTAGAHLLRLVLDSAGPAGGIGNFNYFAVNGGTTGSAPTNLVATTVASTPSATQVALTWSAPPGSIAHYEVERSPRINDAFAVVSTTPTTTSFVDTTAINGKAYLYRVRAVFTGGSVSPYSSTDLATAITFDDDPIIGANDPQGRPGTMIRASHLIQLHTAIDAVRFTAGLSPAVWKNDPAPQTLGAVLAIHFTELRSNLNSALTSLGIATLPTDSGIAISQPVMATHIRDVREKVK